jgi:hypothetical protein
MSKLPAITLVVFSLLLNLSSSFAQDSISLVPSHLIPGYLQDISSKASSLNGKIDKHSQKALQRLQRREAKIKSKLSKLDSSTAVKVFSDASATYKQLEDRLADPQIKGVYIPSLDTMLSSVKFLSEVKVANEKVIGTLEKVKGLQTEFQKAEAIKKFLNERKQYLKEQISKFGFAKELKKLNKAVFYYSEQLNEYKAILKDKSKREKKALELLSQTSLFKEFMRKNSQLASLFRLPGGDPVTQASLAGLQTRTQVSSLIQQQIAVGGANGMQQFQQNMQSAQSQLQQLKDKILRPGSGGQSSGSSDDIMPEGFKPNNQKTKGFLKRLEYGTNVQTTKGNGWFPVTSDLGLSVGYKLNDKSIIGIGGSYKLGWGNNIRNIKISHQGVGLRSFVDVKLKGSFWMSGGYEMNYRSEMRSLGLSGLADWSESGLIGVSKTVSVRSKFFKKTKLQLLWDFLSYEQVPVTQPVVFRVGYHFN